MWTCRCTCGTVRDIPSGNLRNRKTLGCGCKRGERVSKGHTTHGQSSKGARTRLYNTWATIKQRCGKYPGYEYVGMDSGWRESFVKFASDVGSPPSDKHSLHRIGADGLGGGNYEPGNVIWADSTTQNRCKRSTIWLEYRGDRKSLAEWAEILEVPAITLHARIKRYGMTVEEAFNTPIRTQKNNRKPENASKQPPS